MTRLRTLAACDASAARQFAPWQEKCPSKDLYTDMRQHRSARIRALANAEWAAMDDRGRLPDDWEQQRAEIEARFKENGRG